MKYKKHIEKAKEACYSAGKLIVDMQDNINIEEKQDGSAVTNADKKSGEMIKKILLDAFPDYGYMCEETGLIDKKSNYWWSSDPIDGTSCYINHEKTISVSIALHKNNEVILGAVYNPFTNELYLGCEGEKSVINSSGRIKTLPKKRSYTPEQSVLNFHIGPKHIDEIIDLYELLYERKFGKIVSHKGSTAYNLCQVAEGCHGIYIAHTDGPMNTWDIAAGSYLVRKIGGKVTDLHGNDIDVNQKNEFLVATMNENLHEKTLETITKI